jgi:hypothetical protein
LRKDSQAIEETGCQKPIFWVKPVFLWETGFFICLRRKEEGLKKPD